MSVTAEKPVAENRSSRHELAGRIHLQCASARVALAARRLHHQEGIAVDGDVERVAGPVERPRLEIVPGRAVVHVADEGPRS
jgi:hypothetical protein